MLDKQLVGSREICFGSHHPFAIQVCDYQLVLSQDGVLQSLDKEFQFFARETFHDLFPQNDGSHHLGERWQEALCSAESLGAG